MKDRFSASLVQAAIERAQNYPDIDLSPAIWKVRNVSRPHLFPGPISKGLLFLVMGFNARVLNGTNRSEPVAP